MSVLEQVQSDVKDAMKAGERERVHALRLIVSELQKAAKDATTRRTNAARAKRLNGDAARSRGYCAA